MGKLYTVTFFLFVVSSSVFAQWENVNQPTPYIGFSYITSHNGDLYGANGSAVYKSTDDGNTWINLSNNFINNPGNDNRYIQIIGNNIFVGSTLFSVFVSPDNGTTWQMDSSGLDNVNQVDLLYSDGETIFASMGWTTYGFYRKTAAPGPWTRIDNNSLGTSFASEILGMTKIGDKLYACTNSTGIYESGDKGVTWTKKAGTNFPNPIEMFSFASNRLVSVGKDLFVANSDGVYKSSDLGDNWSRVDQNFAKWDQFGTVPIMTLYSDNSNLYASAGKDDSAYVSNNLGNTWEDISNGLKHHIKLFTKHNNQIYAVQWDIDSSLVRNSSLTSIKDKEVTPSGFILYQNFPNPFNPSTNITFRIASPSRVKIRIYNSLGRFIAKIYDKQTLAGSHNVKYSPDNLSSGVYYYQIQVDNHVVSKTMILLK